MLWKTLKYTANDDIFESSWTWKLTRHYCFQVANKDLMVFSAFVERRKEADGPAVRIIGSGLQKRFNAVGKHYCQLWYHGFNHSVSVGPAIYNVIYPSLLHGNMWCSHFVLCKLPAGYREIPYAVSVAATRCETPTNTLMILNRERPNLTDTHGLCISPMYGKYKEWELLVEQIELQKLLGAAEITLYELHVASEIVEVVKTYTDDPTENVNLVQWKFPPGYITNVWCQRAALNDCIYRMGHKHRYVTITDMDEILVPRKEKTWTELIKRLHSQVPQTGAFLFQHAYFRRNTSSENPLLVTQSSFWRTDVVTPPGKIRCKAMYEASAAISIDLHFAYYMVPGAAELILDPEDGMLHHYRPYAMESFKRRPQDYTFIEDRYMELYKPELVDAVNERILKFNFLNNTQVGT